HIERVGGRGIKNFWIRRGLDVARDRRDGAVLACPQHIKRKFGVFHPKAPIARALKYKEHALPRRQRRALPQPQLARGLGVGHLNLERLAAYRDRAHGPSMHRLGPHCPRAEDQYNERYECKKIFHSGGGEIRTHDTFRYAAFPRRCTRPLCDASSGAENIAQKDKGGIACATPPHKTNKLFDAHIPHKTGVLDLAHIAGRDALPRSLAGSEEFFRLLPKNVTVHGS